MFNAARMKKARRACSMTQGQLGNLVGLSAAAIGMYEQRRRLPDADTSARIAWALGVSLDWLCGTANTPEANDPAVLEDLLRECCFKIMDQSHPLTYRGVRLSLHHRLLAAGLIHDNLSRILDQRIPPEG